MAYLSDLLSSEIGPGTPQRKFRVDEVRAMVEQGILREDDHLELIGGILIAAEPQSPYHSGSLQLLSQWFIRRVDPVKWMVRVQMPITVDDYSEPEPDLAIVSADEAKRRDSHPRSAALVVEVANTSLRLDTRAKRMLYAAAGIPEYWVVDVEGRLVLVYTAPEPATATYQGVRQVRPGESLSAAAFPEAGIQVADLFS